MFKHPILDRVFFGFAIISAWGLPSFCLWAFMQPNNLSSWWNYVGLASAIGLFISAFLLTFTIGGLRYVLTGRDLAERA